MSKTRKSQQRQFEFSASATTPTRARLERKVERPSTPAPRVFYTAEVYDLIQFLVAHCEKEVGWLGMVETIGNDYLISAIYVPEQTVHGAETDIDADAMAALAMEILDANEDPGKLFYWGHSHVNMSVSPSGQDEQQVDEYLANCPRFIRGIYNKRGESKVDVFHRDESVVWQMCENRIFSPGLTPEQEQQFKDQIKSNVCESLAWSLPTPAQRTDSYYRDSWKPQGTPGGHRASNGAWLTDPITTKAADAAERKPLTYDDLMDGFEYL